MAILRARLIRSSVTRARADLKRRLSRARGALQAQARREMVAVKAAAVRNWPVATGESAEGIHVTPGVSSAKRFRIEVGVKRTTNQQEIKIENGRLAPHTDRHDHGGRLCSSGKPGGWDDRNELVNVRATRGLSGINSQAVKRPLARAIVEVHGGVVDTEAGKDFVRDRQNVYPPAAIKNDDKLRPRLKAAADKAIR